MLCQVASNLCIASAGGRFGSHCWHTSLFIDDSPTPGHCPTITHSRPDTVNDNFVTLSQLSSLTFCVTHILCIKSCYEQKSRSFSCPADTSYSRASNAEVNYVFVDVWSSFQIHQSSYRDSLMFEGAWWVCSLEVRLRLTWMWGLIHQPAILTLEVCVTASTKTNQNFHLTLPTSIYTSGPWREINVGAAFLPTSAKGVCPQLLV